MKPLPDIGLILEILMNNTPDRSTSLFAAGLVSLVANKTPFTLTFQDLDGEWVTVTVTKAQYPNEPGNQKHLS